jgi:hypothetical protein
MVFECSFFCFETSFYWFFSTQISFELEKVKFAEQIGNSLIRPEWMFIVQEE